ncbi:MAG: helix-turn-helix domain-containing protein [Oscillospiraceae bacterium]|nr:helix-turn-helix domain-containing protein [Oscillospiraceae bacterium]
MFKNKNEDGSLNLCGSKIAKLRKSQNISQRELADALQLLGLDLGKNAIQQIESGKRFVTDIELKTIAQYFKIGIERLFEG